ncbi:probable inactive histone-lysine N-methyltransferase SUVR2 isoform X2 [Brachypodium distachyon]|uniref:probable inactive histone-lysine N-methyltransferase SUVR2 isoform X2 n=1 Tax=Brachypodium distachyon TaxID=15368 RepID=UPI000D0CD912|nr:probable inactive histone-lysine N-methyltransferase SUVR2 isoform X2 [Brachypodium distachyon]|eukprot:XP_024316963.1 probable inactive histone-lysine N-methyltransferase SUVR2 isoform X2 [Brachypodium distachyon]
MAPPNISPEKFDLAIRTMNGLGISRETVSPVLNNLLELYDYNWEHIEADNFLVLAEAIFDGPDPEIDQEGHRRQSHERKNLDSSHCNKKLKSSSSRLLINKPNMESNVVEDTPVDENSSALLLRGQDIQTSESPLAVIYPQAEDSSHHRGHKDARGISGVQPAADQNYKGVSGSHERNTIDACSSKALVSSPGLSSNFEVVLSDTGMGKLSFTYNSSLANRPDLHMPDMASVCKEMEARCLRKYKILDSNFFFMNILEDTCQCIVDLSSESSGPREEGIVQIVPTMDFLSGPSVPKMLQSNQASSLYMPPNNLMMPGGVCSSSAVARVGQSSSSNMQVVKYQPTIGANGPAHDVSDITKGEECVSIPIVNEFGNGILPSQFHYIPHNITYQNAYVNLSLARVGDENCCSDCFGDCLARAFPCACAADTGGVFVYTRDGLLTEGFLDSCLSSNATFQCKVCPLERAKTKVNPDPCKGHLTRKFIKECWSKCGCNRHCGNRVVQRGITHHLEVFLTSGKKGWGLRTAEKLPPGAFVCEYAGEILTNTELYDRNKKIGKEKHTYPLYLDADWLTEGLLVDDHALCLDATFYGNVARFINHRCYDANLITIPVEIETPDHHYYHVAFFTTKQIEPFEELTWDYGIEFDDVNHPIKAFKCCCGSKFCKDKKRISRSKSRALGY